MAKDYINKLFSLIEKGGTFKLDHRWDLMKHYGITEEEYFNIIIKKEISILNTLKDKIFSSQQNDNPGTYEFYFKIVECKMVVNKGYYDESIGDEFISIVVEILPGGTVELWVEGKLGVPSEVKTYDINEELMTDLDFGWEVELEIKDIIQEIILSSIPPVLDNFRTKEIIEISFRFG